MDKLNFLITPERHGESCAIEDLQAKAFGPGRFARAAYRLREGRAPVAGLSFVARLDGKAPQAERLIGSVRFSAVAVAGSGGLLLGPLVVDPRFKDRGCGIALMRTALDVAREAGHGWVVLVGDAPYYGRVGFTPLAPGRLRLPGPVDPARLLGLELRKGALEGLAGDLVPAPADVD
jgi:predicted N-acetyltransferase YhbS